MEMINKTKSSQDQRRWATNKGIAQFIQSKQNKTKTGMHDKEAEGNCLNKKVLISISVFKSELVFKSWTH